MVTRIPGTTDHLELLHDRNEYGQPCFNGGTPKIMYSIPRATYLWKRVDNFDNRELYSDQISLLQHVIMMYVLALIRGTSGTSY